MNQIEPMVFVVDDDASVRRSLERLLRSEGLHVLTFAEPQAFLHYHLPEAPCCLLLDVEMPGLNGLELQQALLQRKIPLPVIFLTGHGNVPHAVQAMKAGAKDFLTKPFDPMHLLDVVRHALASDAQAYRQRQEATALRQRAAALSAREREVMQLVVSGLLNKQVGSRLGVTEKTVKVHRGQVMRKMQAGSLAELVHMSAKLSVVDLIRPDQQ
jgi:FixJ family two-component response regulator